jgi:CheY-like chemotaxis protein
MARILIIEDNAANMQLMAYLLNAFGHTVLEAMNGEIGLATTRQALPDLVLCDLQMPGMDGYEVARRFKLDLHLVTIPLIAVTAYAMVGDRDRVLSAGFDGYIPKPINPELFVSEVEEFLPYTQNSNDAQSTQP